MTPDLVARYCHLVIVDGAMPDDERLGALRAAMTPEEVEWAMERLIAAYIKTLPALPADAPTLPDATDFIGLYLEIIRRGAGPDDPRVTAMLSLMSRDELHRGQRAIGELWLAQPITGPPN